MKYDIIVGIDPDVKKNGVANLECSTRKLDVYCIDFPHTIEFLNNLKTTAKLSNLTYMVVVEASWLIDFNWHTFGKDKPSVAAKKGNDVGRNHETGRKLVEMMEYLNIPHTLQKPLAKGWHGTDHKITHEEFAYATGIEQKRTNQEERDAGLLAWNYARFPIRVRTNKRTAKEKITLEHNRELLRKICQKKK